MLPDFKSKCPFMVPLLQSQRRRFLIVGIGLIVLICGIVVLSFLLTSSEDDRYFLDGTPLFAGRNNLPHNLFTLWGGNLSLVDLKSDLRNVFSNINCSWCNTDIPRLRSGKVSLQFWVVEAGCHDSTNISDTLNQLDIIDMMIKKYPNDFQLIRGSKDIRGVFDKKKVGGLIAIDGGQSIMGSLAVLRIFYKLGVRALTLSSGCYLKSDDEIELKEEQLELIVKEMNSLGMIIDIQGLHSDSQQNILKMSAAPVIISHTAADALFKYEGNTNDQIMELLKSRNGLLMITFDASNFRGDHITEMDVIKHINYIVEKIGFDNIAIGANYDSMDKKPLELSDVSDFPKFFEKLKEMNSSRWTRHNLDKLAGMNFARFFRDVELVRP